MKKIVYFLTVFVVCFVVVAVSAAETFITLTYKQSKTISVDSLGPNFVTVINAIEVTNAPTVETVIKRKSTLAFWWNTAGSNTIAFPTAKRVTYSWTGNAKLPTEATFTNITSNSSIKASFLMY